MGNESKRNGVSIDATHLDKGQKTHAAGSIRPRTRTPISDAWRKRLKGVGKGTPLPSKKEIQGGGYWETEAAAKEALDAPRRWFGKDAAFTAFERVYNQPKKRPRRGMGKGRDICSREPREFNRTDGARRNANREASPNGRTWRASGCICGYVKVRERNPTGSPLNGTSPVEAGDPLR